MEFVVILYQYTVKFIPKFSSCVSDAQSKISSNNILYKISGSFEINNKAIEVHSAVTNHQAIINYPRTKREK